MFYGDSITSNRATDPLHGALTNESPTLKLLTQNSALSVAEKRAAIELQTKQTQALETLAQSTAVIAKFLEGGGLTSVLQGYSKGLAINGILQGLVQSQGRGGLDARFINQNAVDAYHAIDKAYDAFASRLAEKAEANLDPEIHNAEAEYLKFKARNERSDS